MTVSEYRDLAADIVRRAGQQGADAVELTLAEGNQSSVNVRMGEVESITEAGTRGAGIRVLKGKRPGSAYTSDLSEAGLDRMIRDALAISDIATDDEYAGLPDPHELGSIPDDLQLYSATIGEIEPARRIELAKAAEAAAMAADPKISNSEGGSFETHTGFTLFANSLGFNDGYRTSSCTLSCVPIAKNGSSMERDFWTSRARDFAKLESPEEVGRRAAERVLRRLGARKVATQKVPVVFEPRTARSLLDNLFDSISGDSIYRKESFLAGKLEQTIASSSVTVFDDGTLPGLFGSSPFDDEGVPSRRTPVVENGVLKNYLLNTYTARKLGMKTTGNASRGLTGNAGIGHGNFYLEAGSASPDEIIGSVKSGLYVTELIGFGVNLVTGDYSRGAAGLWIENGKLAYPVSEITIASKLQDMLTGIDAIGSDLEFRGSMASPTLLIREMTVSGQ